MENVILITIAALMETVWSNGLILCVWWWWWNLSQNNRYLGRDSSGLPSRYKSRALPQQKLLRCTARVPK